MKKRLGRWAFILLVVTHIVAETSVGQLINRSREAIPGTEGLALGPGVDLSNRQLQGLRVDQEQPTGVSTRGANSSNSNLDSSLIAENLSVRRLNHCMI